MTQIEDDKALLAKIEEQEKHLVFDGFTLEMGLKLGLDLVKIASAEKFPIAIDITRNGQQVFHSVLPGTSPDNDAWITRKTAVVQRFGHSSLYMGVACQLSGISLEDKYLLPPNTYAAHGGAFPITLRHSGVIGAVCVSGLPQMDDHALVVKVIEAMLAL